MRKFARIVSLRKTPGVRLQSLFTLPLLNLSSTFRRSGYRRIQQCIHMGPEPLVIQGFGALAYTRLRRLKQRVSSAGK